LHRKVDGARNAHDVSVDRGVDGDALAVIVSASAEVSRVALDAPVGASFAT
jgi:hypothetical protein